MSKPVIRVLVVDDSATVRSALKVMIRREQDMEVVGSASNGTEAVRMVAEHNPDIVLMDIEMPELDGIEALKRIMAVTPVPVLMFSSIAKEAAPRTLEALDAGAVDFVTKENIGSAIDIGGTRDILLQKIRQFARKPAHDGSRDSKNAAKTLVRNRESFKQYLSGLKSKADPESDTAVRINDQLGRVEGAHRRPTKKRSEIERRDSEKVFYGKTPVAARNTGLVAVRLLPRRPIKLVVIGASTGGPQALRTVLSRIPGIFPVPVVVVQHMPASFVESFAKRLDLDCEAEVKIARQSNALAPGTIWVAPGGEHFRLVQRGTNLYADLSHADIEGVLHKPSVDVMFTSAANTVGGDVLAVVLTGMGRDGAAGAKALHALGATVLAQDEDSSVVYGMPRAVAEDGSADAALPLEEIGDAIVTLVWKAGTKT